MCLPQSQYLSWFDGGMLMRRIDESMILRNASLKQRGEVAPLQVNESW